VVSVTVSIILPAYEEAPTIASVVSSAQDTFGSREHEVVVVDDSPSEATADEVRSRWAGDDAVQLLRRPEQSGLASAVLDGMDAAGGRVYGVMDADGQHPPTALYPLVMRVANGADVAVGSRHTATGRIAGPWPLHRRVISRGARLLAQVAVPQARTLTDPMSGLFAVRADVVEAVRDELRPTGYKILLELLARCPVESVAEHGYEFRERQGGSSNLGPAEYLRYCRHLARLSVPARRAVAGGAAADVHQEVAD
jgi:dolichol-phosphate mannosyltransferase